jgi:hypothetical protein
MTVFLERSAHAPPLMHFAPRVLQNRIVILPSEIKRYNTNLPKELESPLDRGIRPPMAAGRRRKV